MLPMLCESLQTLSGLRLYQDIQFYPRIFVVTNSCGYKDIFENLTLAGYL